MAQNGNAATEGAVGGGSEGGQAWLADTSEHTPTPPHPQASRDRQFRVAGDWALASDGLPWIVQRRRQKAGKDAWQPVSFVRSTKDVLERCLREKGADSSTVAALLADLPETFDQWMADTAGGGRAP